MNITKADDQAATRLLKAAVRRSVALVRAGHQDHAAATLEIAGHGAELLLGERA